MKINGKYNSLEIMTNETQTPANIEEQLVKYLDDERNAGTKIRIMPDYHLGSGICVGFTSTLGDYLNVNTIGVDIGCGITSWKLSKNVDLNELDKIIHENIPSGFNIREYTTPHINDITINHFKRYMNAINGNNKEQTDKWLRAIGTLGGGNHFIELGKDSNEDLWLTVHSGSRNFGHYICQYFNKLSGDGYLEKGSKMFYDYIEYATLASEYAKLNRFTILKTILKLHFNIEYSNIINCRHNYISNNFIRKGAISAEKNEYVLIPFNMRDGIILGKGKGNPDWNFSAPHGAGRILSRKEAKNQLDMNEFTLDMKDVFSSCISSEILDESPRAYKDKQFILDNIKDTVEVIDFIKPIYNFKAK